MRIISGIVILFFYFVSNLEGQSPEARFAKLYPVFNQQKTWSEQWYGTLDGRMHVSMYLARNKDGAFRGVYNYESSGLSFQLEGEIDDEGLINLKEIDSLQRVTGSLVGDIHNDVFSGEWQDYKQYQSLPFELLLGKYPENAGAYQYFKAPKFNDVKALVERKSGSVIISIIHEGEFLKTILEQDQDKKFLFRGTLENSEGIISEILVSLNPDLYYMEIVDDEGKRKSIRLAEQSKMTLIARDHTTFGSTVALLYPFCENTLFNSWMFEELKMWYHVEIKKMARLDQNMSDFMHEERFSKNALAEVSLDLVTNDLVSGIMRFSSSMTDTVRERPFIYSLSKNKELHLSDFFTKNTHIKMAVENLLETEHWYESINPTDDDVYPPYELVTLSNFGLMLRSRFSTLNGQNEVLIHMKALKPYLANNDLARKYGIWQ